MLDEVANTCPVPLPAWLATAAGSGMSIIVAGQSWSQFQHRWGERGAKTIWNSAKAKVLFGAVSDPDDLEVISKLCGEVTLPVWEESRDARSERLRTRRWETVRVLPPEEARMLPSWRAMVIRRHARPTIVRTERVWARADYKRWRASGGQVPLPLVSEHAAMPVEAGRPTWDELAVRRGVRAALVPARPRPTRTWDASGATGDRNTSAPGGAG